MSLTDEQIERYSRNIALEKLGPEGQERIRAGKVLIVGAGGLGSPAALYLAAAGIGALGIVDSDRVELNNLQRQILHNISSLGQEKTLSAAQRIRLLNPDVEVRMWQVKFSAENALELVRDFDFVIDGSDNFATKFLVNDACVMAGKPFSHAGVLGFKGQALTVIPGRDDSPCLRCVLPEIPSQDETPTCAQSGVLGPVAGTLGTIQATEAIKVLTRVGEPLVGRLLHLDALAMKFQTVELKRDPACPVCSAKPRITSLEKQTYE